MKRGYFWAIFLMLPAVAVSCAGRQPAIETGEIEILMGTLSSGVLVTEKGDRYGLVQDDVGRELIKNEGKMVLVTGAVAEKGGRKAMTVTSYQIVEKTFDPKKKAED